MPLSLSFSLSLSLPLLISESAIELWKHKTWEHLDLHLMHCRIRAAVLYTVFSKHHCHGVVALHNLSHSCVLLVVKYPDPLHDHLHIQTVTDYAFCTVLLPPQRSTMESAACKIWSVLVFTLQSGSCLCSEMFVLWHIQVILQCKYCGFKGYFLYLFFLIWRLHKSFGDNSYLLGARPSLFRRMWRLWQVDRACTGFSAPGRL